MVHDNEEVVILVEKTDDAGRTVPKGTSATVVYPGDDGGALVEVTHEAPTEDSDGVFGEVIVKPGEFEIARPGSGD